MIVRGNEEGDDDDDDEDEEPVANATSSNNDNHANRVADVDIVTSTRYTNESCVGAQPLPTTTLPLRLPPPSLNGIRRWRMEMKERRTLHRTD